MNLRGIKIYSLLWIDCFEYPLFMMWQFVFSLYFVVVFEIREKRY